VVFIPLFANMGHVGGTSIERIGNPTVPNIQLQNQRHTRSFQHKDSVDIVSRFQFFFLKFANGSFQLTPLGKHRHSQEHYELINH
jgi:hypothetical protein